MVYFHKTILADQITPVAIYQKVKAIFSDEITFLFESSVNNVDGNFSYIAVGARERITHINERTYFVNENLEKTEISKNPFVFMKDYYSKIDKSKYLKISNELGIGLVDGFIGNIGYDMVCEFEPVLKPFMKNLKDDLQIADFDLVRPKIVLAYSHKNSKLTMITFLENQKSNLDLIESKLLEDYKILPIKKAKKISDGSFEFSKEQFFDMVAKSKEMIKSGDVFQILMSNRFTQKIKIDHLSFYRALRSKNPSPYLFLLQYENFSIAGSSPEVMVRLVDGKILLRPIAGTRKRGKTLEKDLAMEAELLSDEKELAEHLMLIDLGRNDVGRVAKAGTVHVPNIMRIERYSHVMHIVSDVEAELDKKYDMFDLFASCFTAGTMTGAPKIRAMELIAQFEGLKRSFYSGSIAYFGFDGNMDSAITIRTALITQNEIIFQAGAGVVADSKPELEYLEVQNKLAANIATLNELIE